MSKEGKSAILTAEDIFGIGQQYIRHELPGVKKGSKQGVVYLRQPSAGDVLDFVGRPEDSRNEALLSLITKVVVTEDGTPIFGGGDEDRLRDIPIAVFNSLASAVTAMTAVEPANEEDTEGNG